MVQLLVSKNFVSDLQSCTQAMLALTNPLFFKQSLYVGWSSTLMLITVMQPIKIRFVVCDHKHFPFIVFLNAQFSKTNKKHSCRSETRSLWLYLSEVNM
jgi:hypothetical protein